MKIPLRTKANIRFDSKHAVWKYGNLMGVRSAKKLKGALMLLRTMYVLEFIRDMIRDSKSSTLREMYYISEGWDIAKFHAQEESNLLAEDLEVITQLLREDFKLRPEESGASVIGNITLEEITRGGDRKRINCRDDVGDAGYTIPYNVEKEKIKFIEADAKFVLAIETGGMFDRLVENGFDNDAKCILVHLKGQPSRSTRRLLKRLNEELKLPVATFSVSGDERILGWDEGRLRPVTVGPYIDRLMEKHGAVRRSFPIEHERLNVEHLELEVPCITGDGTRLDRTRLSAVIRHEAPQWLSEIQTAYGWSVKVTDSHSIMVCEGYRLTPNLLEDAVRCITNVFPNVHIGRYQPHDYEVQLVFGGRLVSEVIRALGAGTGAHSKAVPGIVFSMDRENQLAFLRSTILGDGHARRRRDGAGIAITTVSRNLASDLVALCAILEILASVRRRKSTPSKVVPDSGSGFTSNTVYDVCVSGELTQLQAFRDLLDAHSDPGVVAKQRINSKFLAIPRELITDDMRRIIRRFAQRAGIGQFGNVYWGCKRITYPVLGKFLGPVPEGKSERLDFLRRLVRHRIALFPVRRILRVPSPGPKVYDFEVPAAQTFLGGLGPICLHNTDGDPWSFRIHASVAYGAIKTAHISEYLATPTAEFVGITASDILNYELPTDALTPRDVGALNAEMSDPRFNDEFWRNEIQTMLQINKKAEQQALAKYGLDYVTDTYLPEKLGPLGLL